MTDIFYSLEPGALVFMLFVVITAVLILFAVAPKWGCGGFLAIIVACLLFLTDNGLVAIGGMIVIGIVFVMSQIAGDKININIEGDGDNNIFINGGGR